MKKRKQNRKILFGLLALLLVAVGLYYVNLGGLVQYDFEVHFIDIGQGDAALVICEGKTMLIDAGNNGDGESIVRYLTLYGVSELDYIVATHPHSDHIGGMAYVINNMTVKNALISPFVHTTKTYENMLDALIENEVATSTPELLESFTLGSARCIVLSDGAGYEDANNASIVLKIEYKGQSVLFTGDAEVHAEETILSTGANLKSDILSVGHHGSVTSTSQGFLDAVSPTYAVISCGVDNSYGHPHREILERLANIEVFRTDELGTIIFGTDGGDFAIR